MSGSNENAASFMCSFSSASRRAGYSALSVGKTPAKTIGLTSLKPGSGSVDGPMWCGPRPGALTAWVTVSPSFVSWTLLMFAGDEADLARAELVERRRRRA